MSSSRWRKKLSLVMSISFVGIAISACGNSTSWKEEVLLHDGRKIIVERTMSYDPKGNREIGQSAPKSEETLSFLPPGSSQRISWRSDFGRTTQDNLDLLALEIVDNIPYIVTYPGFCQAYNKWGRPNPWYVFFKFDGSKWSRIDVTNLPKEVKKANVIVGSYRSLVSNLKGWGMVVNQIEPFVPAEIVERHNKSTGGDPPSLRLLVFVREPSSARTGCIDPRVDGPKAPTSPTLDLPGNASKPSTGN